MLKSISLLLACAILCTGCSSMELTRDLARNIIIETYYRQPVRTTAVFNVSEISEDRLWQMMDESLIDDFELTEAARKAIVKEGDPRLINPYEHVDFSPPLAELEQNRYLKHVWVYEISFDRMGGYDRLRRSGSITTQFNYYGKVSNVTPFSKLISSNTRNGDVLRFPRLGGRWHSISKTDQKIIPGTHSHFTFADLDEQLFVEWVMAGRSKNHCLLGCGPYWDQFMLVDFRKYGWIELYRKGIFAQLPQLSSYGQQFLISEDDSSQIVFLSESNFVDIKRIRFNREKTRAEVEYEIEISKVSPFESILRPWSKTQEGDVIHRQATFIKYDDGWRLDK